MFFDLIKENKRANSKRNLEILNRPKTLDSCVPKDCPYEQSEDFSGIEFLGNYHNYTDSDTWYLSWGEDDKLYSPYTDSIGDGVNGVKSWSGGGKNNVVGYCVVEGDHPNDLKFVGEGLVKGPGEQYKGRYPCANLHHNGVWYLGTYGCNNKPYITGTYENGTRRWVGVNWAVMGGFTGFHISTDNGKTWTQSPLSTNVGDNLFPEPSYRNGPVKLGGPRVVDFGKNMQYSPDGKMYLVGHGTTYKEKQTRKANNSWVSGDQIYMARVTPSIETVNDSTQYEYFCGNDSQGEAIWSKNFDEIKPLIDWKGTTGTVAITYNKPLDKYLMCVTDGWPTVNEMDSYIMESDSLTGPYKMVHYLKEFGPQAYFVNIPSKFISQDGKSFWLCYSANFRFANRVRKNPDAGFPKGSNYSLCLQEVKLCEKDK